MLYISQQLIRDRNLSNEEVLTYVFVQVLTYSDNYDSCLLRTSDVVDQAFGEINSHAINNKMKNNIKSLTEKGYLDIIFPDNGRFARIFMSSFDPTKEDRFIKVDASELRDIVDKTERGKSDVLRFYLLLLSTINSSNTGSYEMRWFSDMMSVTEQTICHYCSHLEKLKKIYVYRPANFYLSNTYGLYKNKDDVITMGEKRSGGRAARADANDKRRCVAIYYQFINGKDYPLDVLNEVYTKLKSRNEKLKSLGTRARGTIYDLQPLIDRINQQ